MLQGTPGLRVQTGSPAEDLVKRLGNERNHGGPERGGSREQPWATALWDTDGGAGARAHGRPELTGSGVERPAA